MTKERLARLFNEWQRRVIECPSEFHSEWESIKGTLGELDTGVELSYGARCAEFLLLLDAQVSA